MSLFKRIWNDIRKGENYDSYLVIFTAFVLVSLDLLQIPVGDYITSITLAVLGLLAISNLGNRHRIDELLKRSRQSTGFIFMEEFPSEMIEDFENARDVLLIGITFTRTIRTYYSVIEQKLKKGHTIKFLLVHPESSAVATSAARTYRPTSAEQKKQEIIATLQSLQELQKISPKKLEIKTIDNPLTYGLRAINASTDNGILYIEHYSYKTEDSKPRIIIRARDGYWYDYFLREARNLWSDGKEWPHRP